MGWIDRREVIISKIIATLVKAKEKGIELDQNNFIIEIMAEYGCARRTAREYLEIAKVKYSNSNKEITGFIDGECEL